LQTNFEKVFLDSTSIKLEVGFDVLYQTQSLMKSFLTNHLWIKTIIWPCIITWYFAKIFQKF